MRQCVPLLAIVSLCASCTGANANPKGSVENDRPRCGGGALPERLGVSEGGRVSLPRAGELARADMTFTGAGVSVVADETSVHVRAPYLAAAGPTALFEVHCDGGATREIPIDVRALQWTRLAEWQESDGAPAREYGAWWVDEAGAGALVVFGGFHYLPKQYTPSNDAWRFDFATSRWSPLAGADLPVVAGARADAIPGARAAWLFGGARLKSDGSIDTPPSLYRLDYDDERITATKATKLGAVPGSYTGAFVRDTRRNRWLSVCGADTSVGLNCLVYTLAGEEGFRRLDVAGSAPDGRDGFHYAYDEETDRVVLFAGQNGQENAAIAGDTWALELGSDPVTWVKLFAEGQGAEKRRNGAFALDSVGHRLFVWGGTADGRRSVRDVQALSLDRGAEAWTSVAIPSDVLPRTSGIGAYDRARERIVLGFGNGEAVYRDLWALDVANVNRP